MSVDLEPLRVKLEPVFVAEVDDALVSIDAALGKLREGGAVDAVRGPLCDALSAMRGSALPLGFDDVATYLHRVEEKVRSAGDDEAAARDTEIIALLDSVAEMMREWTSSVRAARPFDRARFASMPKPASAKPQEAQKDPFEKGGEAQSENLSIPSDTLGRFFQHLMQLEMARTRLHHRLGRARFDFDLEELESHGRALRDLLREVSPTPPKSYVEAQIVRLSGERFALPLSSIVEGRRASRARIVPLAGGRTIFDYDGRRIPVVQLASHAEGLRETQGEFLLVIDPPGAGQPAGAGPIALSVDAIEDPEIVSLGDVEKGAHGGIFQVSVNLASGERARVVDLDALYEAVVGRTSPPATTKTRSDAANAWRTLARRSFNSNEGGRDGRKQ